jgi:hypothetical protein
MLERGYIKKKSVVNPTYTEETAENMTHQLDKCDVEKFVHT